MTPRPMTNVIDIITRLQRCKIEGSKSDRLLAAMACKSAVKAGEYLPREKMEFLVRELFRSANPGVCPHGRPIVVRIPRSQIERGLRRPVSDPAS